MFTAASFIIAKVREESVSVDEWIKKMWYVYTMKYYSALKREDIVICNNMDESEGHYTK